MFPLLPTDCKMPNQRRQARAARRGAALVETAVVLSVFLLLILGTLDLGVATYKYNTLSQAARQGVRQAVVHGALAAPAMTVWGPSSYEGTAADGSEQAQAVTSMLAGFKLSDVTIRVEWIDGGNKVQQRVRYSVSSEYRPIIPSFFSQASYTLSAASTMPITH
ncbi:MAG TPA: TadE/TadG family type IV pilus assembly protein [Pirellulaceae bacterium]|nr:TadE/TadG family type IV pilus assembly protein [Pirellulaceae bacterium]